MKSILLLNDTTRDLGHIGCQEVITNIRFLCEKNGLNVKYSFMSLDLYRHDWFIDVLNQVDAVLVNGEGSLHHDNATTYSLFKNIAIAKKQGKKVILINALWYQNDLFAHALSLFDKIWVRDPMSYHEIKNKGFSPTLVPDLSLYIRTTLPKSSHYPLLFTDSVISTHCKHLAALARKKKAPFRWMNVDTLPLCRNPLYKKIRKSYIRYHDASQRDLKQSVLSNLLYRAVNSLIAWGYNKHWLLTEYDVGSDFIVTGRFHCMLLAMKQGVPFLALSSNTPKMEATLDQVGLDKSKVMFDLQQALSDSLIAESKAYWDKEGLDKAHHFVSTAQESIEHAFESISAMIYHDVDSSMS